MLSIDYLIFISFHIDAGGDALRFIRRCLLLYDAVSFRDFFSPFRYFGFFTPPSSFDTLLPPRCSAAAVFHTRRRFFA